MRKMPDYKIEYGSREWRLYHDPDNEKPVIPLILLSCFLFICKGGILLIILVWVWYFSWAHKNNKKLDNDPKVLESRRTLIKYHDYFNNNNNNK